MAIFCVVTQRYLFHAPLQSGVKNPDLACSSHWWSSSLGHWMGLKQGTFPICLMIKSRRIVSKSPGIWHLPKHLCWFWMILYSCTTASFDRRTRKENGHKNELTLCVISWRVDYEPLRRTFATSRPSRRKQLSWSIRESSSALFFGPLESSYASPSWCWHGGCRAQFIVIPRRQEHEGEVWCRSQKQMILV